MNVQTPDNNVTGAIKRCRELKRQRMEHEVGSGRGKSAEENWTFLNFP